jgi:hypothetical protein
VGKKEFGSVKMTFLGNDWIHPKKRIGEDFEPNWRN